MRIMEKERPGSISTARSIVAVGAVVAAGNGAEHGEVAHAAAAEFGFLRRQPLSEASRVVVGIGIGPGG